MDHQDPKTTTPAAGDAIVIAKAPYKKNRKTRNNLNYIIPQSGMHWFHDPVKKHYFTAETASAVVEALKAHFEQNTYMIFDQELARIFAVAQANIPSMKSTDVVAFWAKIIEAEPDSSWLRHESMTTDALVELTGKAVLARDWSKQKQPNPPFGPCETALAVDAFAAAVLKEYPDNTAVLRSHVHRFEVKEVIKSKEPLPRELDDPTSRVRVQFTIIVSEWTFKSQKAVDDKQPTLIQLYESREMDKVVEILRHPEAKEADGKGAVEVVEVLSRPVNKRREVEQAVEVRRRPVEMKKEEIEAMEKLVDGLGHQIKKGDDGEKEKVVQILRRPDVKKEDTEDAEKPADALGGQTKKADGDEKPKVVKILRRPEIEKTNTKSMEEPADALGGQTKKADGDEKPKVIKILRRPEVKKDGTEDIKELVDELDGLKIDKDVKDDSGEKKNAKVHTWLDGVAEDMAE